MLIKSLLALATASLIQDAVGLSPRQHHHHRIHEKRAVVTHVVTETAWVTVTVGSDAAFSAKKFYTTKGRKRPISSSAAPVLDAVPTPVETKAPAAVPTVETVPQPSVDINPGTNNPAPVDPGTAAPPAPVTPPTPAGGAPGGGRGRGLAFNEGKLLSRFLGSGSKITWVYNWAQTDDSNSGVEFVPMCWSDGKGFPATWAANAQKMIDAGSKYLFSFNEPDNDGQANMTPEHAAQAHINLMNPFAGKAQIGTPSITNSGQPDEGVRWLQRWFDACNGKCAADFVNIHIYGFDTNTFLQHLINVHNQFKKPLWVTEFAFGGSDEEVNRQLGVVIDQIENNSTFSFVHRWSYFMAAEGMMVRGNSMSKYGQTFAYGS